MKRIRKDIEISDLIYKSLRGETSKSEDELLEALVFGAEEPEIIHGTSGCESSLRGGNGYV